MIFKILIIEGPISNASFIPRCHICGVHVCWTEYLYVCIYGNKLIWHWWLYNQTKSYPANVHYGDLFSTSWNLLIANRLWRHQQNKASEWDTGWCVKNLVLASFMDSLCRVRNKIMYVLLWRTVYALTGVLFWCLLINTKITLQWAHKQFVTRVHTLLFIELPTLCFFVSLHRVW